MTTDGAGTPVQPGDAARPPFLNRLFDLPVPEATTGLRWVRPAHHMQRRIARGGVLYMDAARLGFLPRGIDAIFGAKAMSWELSTITDLGLKPGLRKLRVTVTTPDSKQRFIVSDPELVWGDLNAWRNAHNGPAHPVRIVLAEQEEGGASA